MNAVPRLAGASLPTGSDAVLERFAQAAQRVADAISFSDMNARVAACPGWTAYDMVVHLGNVHAWAATIVETGRSAATQHDEPASPRARVVASWYAAKAEDLYQVLRWVDVDQPCWTLVSREGTAGFWRRRQLHETTVHGLDLALASGRSVPIDAGLAADGVGEVLEVMALRMHRKGRPAVLDAAVLLVATDTGDSWTVTPAGGGLPPSVTHRRPGRLDVPDRVEGTAEALYRALWHRPVAAAALRFVGDPQRGQLFVASPLTP